MTHQHDLSAQIQFDGVCVHYTASKWFKKAPFRALHGLDLTIGTENLAVVGPSGAGKSTLIELLFGLRLPTYGEVTICGLPLSTSSKKQRMERCKHIQLIPQEPHTSLNPYYSVRKILLEPMKNVGILDKHEQRMAEALTAVGLEIKHLDYLPKQLSTGQAQRVAIARALVVEPCVLVADEPTSSLDPISRKQVLDLLKHLQKTRHMRLILVTHDLQAAKALCSHVLVLSKGRVAEYGDLDRVLSAPQHTTTQALIQAQHVSTFTPSFK
ncbi:ABC transporter ATP-binding protein [Vibrio breoganii]|uniref:ABC transporter ATP-binding protein n=1 Tax=Vibrio breoganii TaxID=553239 RepID=UPI000C81CB83|nr:dipeptide/oligopeptide/nickel ABC transporter ATP-binding protein [Vibrio breoganii]PMG95038.1 peptide ABC transporter [Vibrio breoganii]PMJ45021.1 peptide ABC transporter [Vibrio breoganii]PMK56263.1 peptide ABC transporter [Vibrio breoganii]PMM87135.1 peptide ABC transporter [Vibrio breoganii]PMO26416.1 peptide ABC transporter [Vibrio breoganii]